MKKKQIIIISAAAAVLIIAAIITVVCVLKSQKDDNSLPLPTVYGKMVYQSENDEGESTLYVYDFEQNEITNVSGQIKDLHDCRDASFNPYGRKIVFSALNNDDDIRRIYMYDLKNGELTTLCPTLAEPQSTPSFSPDGQTVVFSVKNGEQYDIMTVSASSLVITPVVSDGKINTYPCYSEDGACIYYTSGDGKSDTYICKAQLSDLAQSVVYSDEGISCRRTHILNNLVYFTCNFNPVNTTEISARYDESTASLRKINMGGYSTTCCDICPVNDGYALACSYTEDGGKDICIVDIYTDTAFSLSELNKKINTSANECVCDYFIKDTAVYDISVSDVTMMVEDKEVTELKTNEDATFILDVSGGYGDYKYSYYVLKDGEIYLSVARTFTTLISFTPDEPGDYTLKVYAEDEHGNKTSSTYEFTVE